MLPLAHRQPTRADQQASAHHILKALRDGHDATNASPLLTTLTYLIGNTTTRQKAGTAFTTVQTLFDDYRGKHADHAVSRDGFESHLALWAKANGLPQAIDLNTRHVYGVSGIAINSKPSDYVDAYTEAATNLRPDIQPRSITYQDSEKWHDAILRMAAARTPGNLEPQIAYSTLSVFQNVRPNRRARALKVAQLYARLRAQSPDIVAKYDIDETAFNKAIHPWIIAQGLHYTADPETSTILYVHGVEARDRPLGLAGTMGYLDGLSAFR